MWEFYLAASEMSFREQNMMVFQLQLTKRQGVVPITRDYIAREEARLRGAKAAAGRRCASPASSRDSRTRIFSRARGHKSVKRNRAIRRCELRFAV